MFGRGKMDNAQYTLNMQKGQNKEDKTKRTKQRG